MGNILLEIFYPDWHMQWNRYKVVLLIFIIQILKVHNHKEHIKASFLLAAQTSGFSKLLPTRIGECNYKHLNLSGLLNNQFAVVGQTVCQSQIMQINNTGFNNR